MDSTTDRKVAEALGYPILPWGTESERPCIWEGEDCLFVPSTSPADALAALEAWCKDTLNPGVIRYSPGIDQWQANVDPELPNYWRKTLPEVICKAILAAAEAAHG
jgi:hypothetical protein